MNYKLTNRIEKSSSLLCVGLDPEKDVYESHMVLEATAAYAACYKVNLAFFLSKGEMGIGYLQALIRTIPVDIPVILDGKFGDIGNTAEHYAHFAFQQVKADGVTVNPYMGEDAIKPFAEYTNRMVFSLVATSNPSGRQLQKIAHPYNRSDDIAITAARLACKLGDNVGFVVGDSSYSFTMRHQFPKAWFLCPGVGAQGGSLQEFVKNGLNEEGTGLLINVGRGITSAAANETNYMDKLRAMSNKAREYRNAINQFR